MKIKTSITLITTLVFLSACSALGPKPNDPAYAPVPLDHMRAPENNTGAIYQEGYSLALFETIRARRIGDMLTIALEEQTTGEKKATTNQTKTNSTSVENPTILGKPVDLRHGRTLEFQLDSDHSFDGEAESKQNNRLQGNITVTVSDVLPNGYLVVRGEKWITINRGKEYIRLKGIVRPADIRPDNSVPSYKVADARIEYSGTGQVADSNVMGWLSRFFISALWPF